MNPSDERYFTDHRGTFIERRHVSAKRPICFYGVQSGSCMGYLNVYAKTRAFKSWQCVRVVPETAPASDFRATIDFIEPFYRKENKTLTARVYFNNRTLKIPIGSQVRATIFGNTKDAYWLPKEAVVSLGVDEVVFQKSGGGFKAHKIKAGMTHKNHIQVLSGLNETDSVAANAQYLMDSESFIKVKN